MKTERSLFTYDCEDNGRSYVVFTTGEGAQQRLFANRYDTRDDGQLALLALENEQEYAIIKHCFEELKAKLAEQAGVRCQVSMERGMVCGFGACATCVVQLLSERYL